jgi:hypothetical protein
MLKAYVILPEHNTMVDVFALSQRGFSQMGVPRGGAEPSSELIRSL